MTGVIRAAELAERIGARIHGDGEIELHGLASLNDAHPGQLSHLSSPAYRAYLPTTRASAVILRAEDVAACPATALVTQAPYLAYAKASQLFDVAPPWPPGVDERAQIGADVELGNGIAIGPFTVVGDRTVIGNGVVIGAGTVIGEDCRLGDRVRIMANVTVYHDVWLGADCVVHSGAVIGADGFGYAADEHNRRVTIAQLGGVRIGNWVDVGANSTIDRGAIEHTRIGDGVKIDNQVQVGHNCVIGDHAVLCGCVGLAGGTHVGAYCVLGGAVTVAGAGPVEIADGVVIGGMTHVTRSIAEAGMYSGGILQGPTRQWKKNALRFADLDAMARRLAKLEKQAGTD